jgi:hypothetical protein
VKDTEKPLIVAIDIMPDESVIAEYDERDELAKAL